MTTATEPQAAVNPETIIWRCDLPAKLNKSTETIRRWLKEGKLPTPDVNLSLQARGWKLRTLHEAGIKL